MAAELTTTGEKQDSLSGDLHTEHSTKLAPPSSDPELQRIAELSAKLENPLSGFSTDELIQQAEEFCQAHGLNDQRRFLLVYSLTSSSQ